MSDELFDKLDKEGRQAQPARDEEGLRQLEAEGTVISSRRVREDCGQGRRQNGRQGRVLRHHVQGAREGRHRRRAPRAPEGAILRTAEAPAPAPRRDGAADIPRAHADVPEAIPWSCCSGPARRRSASRRSSRRSTSTGMAASLAELTVYFENNGALEVLAEMDPGVTGKASRAAWTRFSPRRPADDAGYMMSPASAAAALSTPPPRLDVATTRTRSSFSEGHHPWRHPQIAATRKTRRAPPGPPPIGRRAHSSPRTRQKPMPAGSSAGGGGGGSSAGRTSARPRVAEAANRPEPARVRTRPEAAGGRCGGRPPARRRRRRRRRRAGGGRLRVEVTFGFLACFLVYLDDLVERRIHRRGRRRAEADLLGCLLRAMSRFPSCCLSKSSVSMPSTSTWSPARRCSEPPKSAE